MKSRNLIDILLISTLSFTASACASLFDFSLMGNGQGQYRPQEDTIEYESHEQSDVYLGMTMRDVKSAWGTPRRVMVAGRGNDGNQKWVYPSGESSYLTGESARVLYFENGRVVGWETH